MGIRAPNALHEEAGCGLAVTEALRAVETGNLCVVRGNQGRKRGERKPGICVCVSYTWVGRDNKNEVKNENK